MPTEMISDASAVDVLCETAVAEAEVPLMTWPRYEALVAPLTCADGIFTFAVKSPIVGPSESAGAVYVESEVTMKAPVVPASPPSPPAIVSAAIGGRLGTRHRDTAEAREVARRLGIHVGVGVDRDQDDRGRTRR